MKIKICPKCGSIDVNEISAHGPEAPVMIPKYRCNNCGFVSEVFWEKEVETKENKKKK